MRPTAPTPGLVSVIVLAHSRTVYERYYDSVATEHHHVWSVTKKTISTLVGMRSAK